MPQERTIRELAELFLKLAPSRDKALSARLNYWLDRLPTELTMEQLDRTHVRDVMLELRGSKSGPTCNRYRASFCSLIKWCRAEDLVDYRWASPFVGMPMAKENPGRLRFLSPDEEERLLAACKLCRWVLLPLLVRTAIQTGLRAGSLKALRWADVLLDDGSARIVVERTKSGRPHIAPVTDALADEFRRYRRKGWEPQHLVFCSTSPFVARDYRESFRVAVEKAGLAGTGVTFHSLRHTSASRLAAAGVPLNVIADHMTHASLDMTRRYAHLTVDSRAAVVKGVFG